MGKNNAKDLERICEFFNSRTCNDWQRCNGYGVVKGVKHGSGGRINTILNCRSYSPIKKVEESYSYLKPQEEY